MTLEELQQAVNADTFVRFLVVVAQATISSIEKGGATLELSTDWQGEATSALIPFFIVGRRD
jgi:hypothetical protein